MKWLTLRNYHIVLGLLTRKALKGYKDEVVPFKDRMEIMKMVASGLWNIEVVPQDSLDPSENIRKYKPQAIASGDGWEKCELEAIKKFRLKKVNINFPKKHSSSAILNKFCNAKIHI